MTAGQDPGKDERHSIARSANLAARGIYGSWFVWLGLTYSFTALIFVSYYNAPLARAIGLPEGTIEALIFDLAVLMVAPMTAIMWWHMRKVAAARRRIKEAFLARHDGSNLLVSRHNRQLVFEIVDRSHEDGQIEVRPIWNADGPVTDGRTYVENSQVFAAFDREQFLSD